MWCIFYKYVQLLPTYNVRKLHFCFSVSRKMCTKSMPPRYYKRKRKKDKKKNQLKTHPCMSILYGTWCVRARIIMQVTIVPCLTMILNIFLLLANAIWIGLKRHFYCYTEYCLFFQKIIDVNPSMYIIVSTRTMSFRIGNYKLR